MIRPFHEFVRLESSAGILLLISTVVALAWANSPLKESYGSLWQTELSVGAGGFLLRKPLLHWINDGLMTLFFLLVGLEIKRELLVGELSSPRQAMLPILAALGGMVVPAVIYALFNSGKGGSAGWGIPMATDIAFAVGVLSLLGKQVPIGLKVFLTALAIVDDIGAVLVIALYYTGGISVSYLAIAAGVFLLLVVMNRIQISHPLAYLLIGAIFWYAVSNSGVHATVTGVLLAMVIPARARVDKGEFLRRGTQTLENFKPDEGLEGLAGLSAYQRSGVRTLKNLSQRVETPMERLEPALHPWVTFFIMPIFALANAGITFQGTFGSFFGQNVAIGVFAGLVLGKQIGITSFAWLAVRMKLALLPSGVRWRQIYGAGWLGGIGFTMSLFIATLAFGEGPLLFAAKVGILCASAIAGGIGYLLLRRLSSH